MARFLAGRIFNLKRVMRSPSQQQQLRYLNIHEYQGAELMSKFGVNVPKGVVVSSIAEVKQTISSTFATEKEVVVKSQILAGGRGLGTFKNGFKGGVHIAKVEEAEDIASKMLGQVLVTKQTGPGGKPVNKVYICQKLSLVNEMYFAITLDRASAGPEREKRQHEFKNFHEGFQLDHERSWIGSTWLSGQFAVLLHFIYRDHGLSFLSFLKWPLLQDFGILWAIWPLLG